MYEPIFENLLAGEAIVKIKNQVQTLLVVLGAMCALPVYAQTVEHESAAVHDVAHDFHPNFFGMFVGVTSEARREKGIALGIEYERRLNKSFGIGLVAEHTFGDLDFWVYAVPFAYHTGRWKFYIAPGIEDGDHGRESLLRIGGEYAYEFGEWEISPQLDLDFVDGEQVWVLGVVFGKGF